MDREIGQALREAREGRGIGLEEVERATKIRVRYIAAIEDERWDVLPGRAYAHGFLRTYAEFLGLDPAPLTEQLRHRLEPTTPEEAPPDPVVQPGTLSTRLRRRVVVRSAAAILGLAAIVALVAIAIAGGERDPDQMVTPPPPAPPVAEEPPDEPEPPAPEPERAELEIDATGTVWVCLVDGRGNALVNGETLTEGEDRGPFEARRMLITLGNGQAELTADGEAVEVPDAAEPLGYEVTVEGVSDLEPAERPTCA